MGMRNEIRYLKMKEQLLVILASHLVTDTFKENIILNVWNIY